MIYWQTNILMDLFLNKYVKLTRTELTNFVYIKNWFLNNGNKDNFFLTDEKNWFLIINRDNFDQAYFWLEKDIVESDLNLFILKINNFLKEETRKPVIVEYVSKNTQNYKIDDILKRMGFNFYIAREKLSSTLKDIQYFSYDNCRFLMKYSDDFYLDAVMDLMNNSFEPYTSCIHTRGNLEEIIKKNNIIIALDKQNSNQFVGFLEFNIDKNKSSITHLAVNKNYRGIGISSLLLEFYINEMKNLNLRELWLWVQMNNEPAQALYKKHNYTKDNMLAISYIGGSDDKQ